MVQISKNNNNIDNVHPETCRKCMEINQQDLYVAIVTKGALILTLCRSLSLDFPLKREACTHPLAHKRVLYYHLV